MRAKLIKSVILCCVASLFGQTLFGVSIGNIYKKPNMPLGASYYYADCDFDSWGTVWSCNPADPFNYSAEDTRTVVPINRIVYQNDFFTIYPPDQMKHQRHGGSTWIITMLGDPAAGTVSYVQLEQNNNSAATKYYKLNNDASGIIHIYWGDGGWVTLGGDAELCTYPCDMDSGVSNWLSKNMSSFEQVYG